jgi:hypothetical protein
MDARVKPAHDSSAEFDDNESFNDHDMTQDQRPIAGLIDVGRSA